MLASYLIRICSYISNALRLLGCQTSSASRIFALSPLPISNPGSVSSGLLPSSYRFTRSHTHREGGKVLLFTIHRADHVQLVRGPDSLPACHQPRRRSLVIVIVDHDDPIDEQAARSSRSRSRSQCSRASKVREAAAGGCTQARSSSQDGPGLVEGTAVCGNHPARASEPV